MGAQGYYYYYLVGFLILKKQVIYWLSVISEKSGPIGVKSKMYFINQPAGGGPERAPTTARSREAQAWKLLTQGPQWTPPGVPPFLAVCVARAPPLRGVF